MYILKEVASEIEIIGVKSFYVSVDISSLEKIEQAIEKIMVEIRID